MGEIETEMLRQLRLDPLGWRVSSRVKLQPKWKMLEIKLILCPVDFSEFSVRAYRHSLSVAQHYRAKLVALHIVELWRYPSLSFVPPGTAYDETCQALCKKGEQKLQELVRSNTLGKTPPELAVELGDAADTILSVAARLRADAIVMGTHGRRGYDRLMLGSVAERVMRNAPCPVLVVNKPPDDLSAASNEVDQEHRLHRILFCTDFSENSERALNYAISAATEYDAELTLMHVLEEKPANTDQAIAATRQQLERLIRAEVLKTLNNRFAVRVGKPYEQIIQFATDAHPDIIAMGVRGRGSLDLAVFGSTTYRVIQLGPCPVLAVRI
jgi:nucleotide-binding universal stress UspA family protein